MNNDVKDIIEMYSNATQEDKDAMIKIIHLFAEEPGCIEFAKHWEGNLKDLAAALVRI